MQVYLQTRTKFKIKKVSGGQSFTAAKSKETKNKILAQENIKILVGDN